MTNQQPITVTYSLEDILTRLEQKIDRVENKIDKLDERVGKLEVGIVRLQEKIGVQEKFSFTVLSALLIANLGLCAKLFNFFGNP